MSLMGDVPNSQHRGTLEGGDKLSIWRAFATLIPILYKTSVRIAI